MSEKERNMMPFQDNVCNTVRVLVPINSADGVLAFSMQYKIGFPGPQDSLDRDYVNLVGLVGTTVGVCKGNKGWNFVQQQSIPISLDASVARNISEVLKYFEYVRYLLQGFGRKSDPPVFATWQKNTARSCEWNR